MKLVTTILFMSMSFKILYKTVFNFYLVFIIHLKVIIFILSSHFINKDELDRVLSLFFKKYFVYLDSFA